MIGPYFNAIFNHLWQSTIFALAVTLLALVCRNNRAQVRYWLWLSASLKFLIPFALLMALGNSFRETLPVTRIAPAFVASDVPLTMMQIARPFPGMSFAPAAPHLTDWLGSAVLTIWACGFAAIVVMRLRSWIRVRAAVQTGTLIDVGAPVEVRTSASLLEPGVFGFLRPTLLLPQGIMQTLTPSQLQAILAHELSHIRRHDNLTAALHMLVEVVFWFYPLVWWIGARLVQERERACDEAVLSLGNEPGDYAEAILTVCRLYVESPLTCVSGVTGPSLNRRIRAILTHRLAGEPRVGTKIGLAMTGLVAVAAPIVIGMMNAPLAQAQRPSLAVPSKADRRPTYLVSLGTVSANTVTVSPRLDGQLIAVNFQEGRLVQKGQLLASLDRSPYEIQLVAAQRELARDQAQLDAAGTTQGSARVHEDDAIAQLSARVQTDRARLETAERQLSYANVTAPITGIAGFRLADVGNFVHSGERLVVINQLQPIAVLFSIPEDHLPEVRTLLEAGANPTVVLSNRDGGTKIIATGRLVAADNQIDAQTATVTLKASFENKDGALFPNEFVNVRLLVACAKNAAFSPGCR